MQVEHSWQASHDQRRHSGYTPYRDPCRYYSTGQVHRVAVFKLHCLHFASTYLSFFYRLAQSNQLFLMCVNRRASMLVLVFLAFFFLLVPIPDLHRLD